MQTVKVFTTGRSQAVRIPKEYRFNVDEVFVNKIGDTLILTPISKLGETMDQGVAAITDDFLEDGFPEEVPSSREEL